MIDSHWAAGERSAHARAMLVAAVLGVVTLLALVASAPAIGYVRDEGVYFEASRRYGSWLGDVARAPKHLADQGARDRAFGFNAEHPPLMKLAGGVSALALSKPVSHPGPGTGPSASAKRSSPAEFGRRGGWLGAFLDEGAAMRFPAHLLSAIGVALLAYLGCLRAGLAGAVLASGAFILLPRVAYHAALHTFDVPVAILIFATVICWHRALESIRWAVACGLVLGLAVATKHNALFVGPLLAVHYWCAIALQCRARREWPQPALLFPFPVLALGIAFPTLVVLWPWLWHDTFARLYEYLYFHGAHAYYNVEFLGTNYNRPPLPWTYPWVMTLATVPATILALAAIGGATAVRDDLKNVRHAVGRQTERAVLDAAPLIGDRSVEATRHAASFWRPLPLRASRVQRLSWVLFAVFPLLLIALPSVPIFGGTKHWITAYPFVALLAVEGLDWLARALTPESWRAGAGSEGTFDVTVQESPAGERGSPRPAPRDRDAIIAPLLLVAAVLAISPGAIATVRGHPHNLSQYAPLVGGPRGAAQLGLQRGFWGGPALAFLPAPGDPPEVPGPMDIHDLHEFARTQYLREGRWPLDWQPIQAQPGGRARSALHFYEAHMLSDEVRVWNSFGRTDPARVVTLDDVPIASLYVDTQLP